MRAGFFAACIAVAVFACYNANGREIGSYDTVEPFIARGKAGETRLQGFGHRVYKNFDPRATIIKRTADEVFRVTGQNPLLDIALKLEEVALQDGHGEPQPCGVRTGELDGLGGQVRREHHGIGSLLLDGERDRAGARARVDDDGVLAVAGLRERVLDEEPGLGPRDEPPGPYLEP